MLIKKSGGKIFGAQLSSAEKKAMDIEIRKELADYDRKNVNEIDAIILWELHEQLGLGKDRLKKFHDGFVKEVNELLKRYEFCEKDQVWLCTKKLLEIGVDIKKWNEEG